MTQLAMTLKSQDELEAQEWFVTLTSTTPTKGDKVRRGVKQRRPGAKLMRRPADSPKPEKARAANALPRKGGGADRRVNERVKVRIQREQSAAQPVRHISTEGYEYESELPAHVAKAARYAKIAKAAYERGNETPEERAERKSRELVSEMLIDRSQSDLNAIKGLDSTGRELKNHHIEQECCEVPHGRKTMEEFKEELKQISQLPSWMNR